VRYQNWWQRWQPLSLLAVGMFGLGAIAGLTGKSLFNYRRIVSPTRHNPYTGRPQVGDISMINWNQGNDWNWMNPPLVLGDRELVQAGQYQNWMGGLSQSALKFAEENALMFARWKMTCAINSLTSGTSPPVPSV
jgi:hypothetical protein